VTQTIPPFGKLRDLLAMSSEELIERHKSAKSDASHAAMWCGLLVGGLFVLVGAPLFFDLGHRGARLLIGLACVIGLVIEYRIGSKMQAIADQANDLRIAADHAVVVLGAESVPADVIVRATALYLSIQDALGLPWLSIDADELDEEDE